MPFISSIGKSAKGMQHNMQMDVICDQQRKWCWGSCHPKSTENCVGKEHGWEKKQHIMC